MNTAQLARWKAGEEARALEIVTGIENISPSCIRRIYPEWDLSGAYGTSIEPEVPVWVMVPFFSKVIVGIFPHFRDENAFSDWYGVSPRQMLHLYEKGHVLIRALLPRSRTSIPRFLNPFFGGEFPSTARDTAFSRRLLGNRETELKARFSRVISGINTATSIDGFSGNKGRAVRTAEAVFLQLHALGYGHEASQFESMFPTNSDAAMKWLELCRRFLFGPYHYSLLGVHSIPRSCEALTPIKGTVLRFPSELGRILVEAFELIRYVDAPGNVTLDEVLAVHPDFELARNALLALDSALRSNREEQVVKHVEDLKAILEKAKAKERFYLHSIKYVIAAGATIATAPMSPALGVLTGLGIGTVEFVGEKVDRLTIPLARKFVERQFPHLGLILKLDESVRKSFSR